MDEAIEAILEAKHIPTYRKMFDEEAAVTCQTFVARRALHKAKDLIQSYNKGKKD